MKILSAVLVCITASSCGYRHEKATTPVNQVEGKFAVVYETVFKAKCVGCHGNSGGVNLETYESVISNIDRVRERLEQGTMPPSGPLSSGDSDLVLAWISEGAPRN
jgi:hypothetical protein